MSTSRITTPGTRRLASALADTIVLPEHARYDQARQAWNLAVDQQPSAVVFPESAQDVASAILFAREYGQRVAAQGTGHNAAPLGSLHDTILVKTERMRRVEIDPESPDRASRGGRRCGPRSSTPPPQHGLAALAGSSPDVGVVGYTLGGGVSLLGRKYGLASNAASMRSSSSPPTVAWYAPTASTSPTCSGRCAAAAAASPSSPRSSSSWSRSARSTRESSGTRSSAAARSCTPGAS